MACEPYSPIAAFPTASFLPTPKCRHHSKDRVWQRNLRALRSISHVPIVSGLFRSVRTSPVSFASTRNIRISFLPTTCRGFCPADSLSHVFHSRRLEILTGEIRDPPPPPFRASESHRRARPFPHRKSHRPRSLLRPPQRPHRGNRSLSARRPCGSPLPRPNSAHSFDVSRSRPCLYFLQLWRALHAQCR